MWYNRIMVGILRSAMHSLISNEIMIIGFKGAKSGKKYSTPVNYLEIDGNYYVMSDRSRVWWKNIKTNPEIEMYIKRKRINGMGVVYDTREEVEKSLALIIKHKPQMAKYLKVAIVNGESVLEDIKKLSDKNIVISITQTT